LINLRNLEMRQEVLLHRMEVGNDRVYRNSCMEYNRNVKRIVAERKTPEKTFKIVKINC
jgi:hypothetical protein